jgi:hypothetical protein
VGSADRHDLVADADVLPHFFLGLLGLPGAALSLSLVTALSALEFLVAFLQAFVFMMLTLVYIGQAHDAHLLDTTALPIEEAAARAFAIIDAALTNGGNRVAGLDFLVKDRAKAQEVALTQAVESARRQAEVAAKAAGGQIAELLELTINEYERQQPRAVMAMAKMEMADAAAPTPVSEGMATIAVSVTTRWRFTK